jgi:hypothetical protein
LTGKTKRAYLIQQSSNPRTKLNKPFWLSSVNYYFLTAGIAIAAFFLIWGVLHLLEEQMPWITAGVFAGVILILAVILREFVFKKTYQRNLIAQKMLDQNIRSIHNQSPHRESSNRLTLERNKAVINEIEKRSKTAQSIGNLPEMHLEVFEMCHEYLRKSARELGGIFKESPRYLAIKRGQKRLEQLHRFHLLSWASLESQGFIQAAKIQVAVNDKIENAQRGLAVLDTAIQFYPGDEKLLQSKEVIKDFIVSIKVSHWVEQAERAAFKNHYQRAINHYRDALFFLARENERTAEKEKIAEEINLKIEELRSKTNRK